MKQLSIIAGLLLGASAQATPVLISGNHIRYVEASYAPGSIRFKIDSGDSHCTRETTLLWQTPNTDNAKAMYASLLAAYLAQSPVNIVYDDIGSGSGGDAGSCLISQVGVGNPS